MMSAASRPPCSEACVYSCHMSQKSPNFVTEETRFDMIECGVKDTLDMSESRFNRCWHAKYVE